MIENRLNKNKTVIKLNEKQCTDNICNKNEYKEIDAIKVTKKKGRLANDYLTEESLPNEDYEDINLSYSKFSVPGTKDLDNKKKVRKEFGIESTDIITTGKDICEFDFYDNINKNKLTKVDFFALNNEFIEDDNFHVKENGSFEINENFLNKDKFDNYDHSVINHFNSLSLESLKNSYLLDFGITNKKYSSFSEKSFSKGNTNDFKVQNHDATISENFKFFSLIGKGGFAYVYKGVNLKTNKTVAIKQIILKKDQDVMELMGEIDLLKILNHPNIVKYHGFVKTSDSLNILLEFCAGGSLRQMYKKLGFGLLEPQIIPYATQILQGLNYLHEQGVVHRDVKAANVLISENGILKLTDFGISEKVTSQNGTIVGTPNWMAPETILGGDGICTASDVWSFGATIIELLTMKPPYHDLNPMAVLHAIGTDDHPPFPKKLSASLLDFLSCCFQKQPHLRSTAVSLLKHKWLNTDEKNVNESNINTSSKLNNSKFLNFNDENLKIDFDNNESEITKNNDHVQNFKNEFDKDSKEYYEFENDPNINLKSKNEKDLKSTNSMKFISTPDSNDNEFSLILTKNILKDENNTYHNDGSFKFQKEMEDLNNMFSKFITNFKNNEKSLISFTIIVEKIIFFLKRYLIMHDVLIKNYGILNFIMLLNKFQNIKNIQKLICYILFILNNIFDKNIKILENFSSLGGLPLIINLSYDESNSNLKMQILKMIKVFQRSEKVLSMFLSCGGIGVFSNFLLEDFDSRPFHLIVVVECIHNIIFKSNDDVKLYLLMILSNNGFMFRFIVLLNRLIKINYKPAKYEIKKKKINSTIDKIINILHLFTHADINIKLNISTPYFFNLLIKIFSSLNYDHQMIVLKFFESLSSVFEILKTLDQANFLTFLFNLLKKYTYLIENFKELLNVVSSALYNCCYLDHIKEEFLVKMGAVSYLKKLSVINLPFRQYILPILCELVYCDNEVREILKSENILQLYYHLLIDSYWQFNALESILFWIQNDPNYVKLDSQFAIKFLIKGFIIPKASNLESILENYLKIITINKNVCKMMVKEQIINNIVFKLDNYNKNSVIQLNLLRILKTLIMFAIESKLLPLINNFTFIKKKLMVIKSKNNSILIEELLLEILASI